MALTVAHSFLLIRLIHTPIDEADFALPVFKTEEIALTWEFGRDKRALIDFIRGSAIFLMLWGHSIQYSSGGQIDFFEDVAFKAIYSFHMPLFMLISGYLFHSSAMKRDLFELVEHKVKTILYPILMCSLLNLLLTNGVVVFLRRGAGATSLLGAVPLTSLWFLWSVLSCSVAMALVVKLTDSPVLRVALAIAGFGFVALFPCWEMNVWMWPYFVVGYVFAASEARFVRMVTIIGVTCTLAFLAMLVFYRSCHYIYSTGLIGGASLRESFAIDVFRWAIGLFGAMSTVCVGIMMTQRLSDTNVVRKVLEALGHNSLAIYALSVSLLSFWWPRVASRLLELFSMVDFCDCLWVYDCILTPIVAVVYSLLLLWIVRLFGCLGLCRLVFGR